MSATLWMAQYRIRTRSPEIRTGGWYHQPSRHTAARESYPTLAAGVERREMVIDLVWAELVAGIPDLMHLVRTGLRLLMAMLAGAVVGSQREKVGQSAGLRTHMLVAMGGALFVLVPLEVGMTWSDVARVIQGLTAGIGFLGGGAILKWHEAHEVHGLTTAAGLWMTAAIGVASGLGRFGTALLGALLTWVVLAVLAHLERPHASPQRT
jgi:putative Mg2+ transporter-C (MgtC) family protein